jgi:hypothetical protein
MACILFEPLTEIITVPGRAYQLKQVPLKEVKRRWGSREYASASFEMADRNETPEVIMSVAADGSRQFGIACI